MERTQEARTPNFVEKATYKVTIPAEFANAGSGGADLGRSVPNSYELTKRRSPGTPV
jgi:hypothetical protein